MYQAQIEQLKRQNIALGRGTGFGFGVGAESAPSGQPMSPQQQMMNPMNPMNPAMNPAMNPMMNPMHHGRPMGPMGAGPASPFFAPPNGSMFGPLQPQPEHFGYGIDQFGRFTPQ